MEKYTKTHMKEIHLVKKEHQWKSGNHCPYIEPNITEDCLFIDEEGKTIGFFMKKLPEKMSKIANIANTELRSNRVPKSTMERSEVMTTQSRLGLSRKDALKVATSQYSTIIGSIPPKAHMRRYLPNHSSVHNHPGAALFIKAMWGLAIEGEELIRQWTPEVWKEQKKAFEEIDGKWRFGNIFTSSISNYNISAQFHKDTGNLPPCVNMIITKRQNSRGGNLYIPDYDACIDQCDNSILVYPAWRNLHAVTPIIPIYDGGWRNSLVFYPLAAFTKTNLKKAEEGGEK